MAITGIVEGAEGIAKVIPEVSRFAGGGVKAAEGASEGVAEAARGGEAAKAVEAVAEDAKSTTRFAGAKSLGKAGVAGAVGDAVVSGIESALGGETGTGDGVAENGSNEIPASGQTAAGSGGNNEPPPTGVGEAGGTDSGEPINAPEKTATVSSDEDSIISILREILNVQTESLSELQIGFRSLFQAFQQNTNSLQQQMQGNLVQQESRSGSAGSGGGAESAGTFSRIGGGIKGLATTLGVTALVGGLLSMVPDSVWGKEPDKDKSPASSNTTSTTTTTTPTKSESPEEKAIDEAKEKFGNDKYAEVIASRIIGKYMREQHDNPEVRAESNTELAADQFGLIMKFYDMLDQNGKNQIVALLANLNHMKKEDVEHMIHVQSSAGVKAFHGIESGLNQALLGTIGGIGKSAHGVIGAGAALVGAVQEGFGANGDNMFGFAHHEFNGANKSIDEWERKQYMAGTEGAAIGQSDSGLAKTISVAGQAAGALVGSPANILVRGALMAGGAADALTTKDFDQSSAIQNAVGGGVVGTMRDGGKTPRLSGDVKQREKQAIDFFVSKGWSQAQAEGIVANLMVESAYTLDPHQKQKGGGGGYGIAQWTSKDRKQKFADIEKTSLENSTFEQQLDFVNWELTHTESRAGGKLKSAKTASDAAEIITRNYERPAAMDQQAAFRGAYASTIAKAYSGSQTSPTISPDSVSPGNSMNPGNKMIVADNSTGPTTITNNANISTSSAAAPAKLRAAQG